MVTRLTELGYQCIVTSSSKKGTHNLDLNDPSSIEEFCSSVKEIFGVIFMSGKKPEKSLKDLSWEHLSEMDNINFKGVLWCCKFLVPKIKENGFILFTSSVASKKGSYDPAYSSTKSAIEGLTITLAKELAPTIRVNCVSPGLVKDSPVYLGMSPDFQQKHLDSIPLKKLANLNEIVDGYLFLIKNTHFTAQILQINGGQYA